MRKKGEKSTDPFAVNAMHVIRFQTDRIVGDTGEFANPDMQILLILHGTAEMAHPEGAVSLVSGDLLSIRPGVKTSIREAKALQILRCSFNPRTLRRRLGDAFDAKALYILSDSKPVRQYDLSADRFRSIASILTAANIGGDMGNIGRTLLLLESIVEYGRTQVPNIHGAILSAIKILDEDISRDWSLTDIASMLDLDPSYVARLFKSAVGMPPLAYLSLLRAEESASLLSLSKLPCALVGSRVGWTDPNYFSRRFRQHFGESPSVYRERAIGQR